MFKNSKDNNDNFINKEELDKAYKHQEKLFNSKIEEQQNQINELVDYISAKFGEDYKKSDVNIKIKDLEDAINKANEGNINVFHEYNEQFAKNKKEIKELKEIIDKKDEKIAELNKTLEKYSNENQEYKKQIAGQFEDTNKKISKINYLGITSKFDRKLKEENEKLKDRIQKLNKEIDEYVFLTKQAMIEGQEGIKKCNNEITGLNTIIANNNDMLDKKLLENNKNMETRISEIEKQTSSKVLELSKNIVDNINNIEEKLKSETLRIDRKTDSTLVDLNNRFNTEKNSTKALLDSFKTDLTTKLTQNDENTTKKMKRIVTIVSSQGDELKNKITIVNKSLNSFVNDSKEYNSNIASKISGQEEKANTKFDDINLVLDKYNKDVNAMQEQFGKKIEEISNNLLTFKKELDKNSKNNSSDIELNTIKKGQNEFATKVSKQLNTLQNELSEAKKKNVENIKKLKLSVKTYVDKKMISSNTGGIKGVDEIVDKLNLSMAEKEKIRKKENEEFLSRKIKEIQKENERILSKKIEELNQMFKNESQMTSTNDDNYTVNVIRPKKKIYDILDEGTMLQQAASSNKDLKTKEGKSQLLKIFYDDDDLN